MGMSYEDLLALDADVYVVAAAITDRVTREHD